MALAADSPRRGLLGHGSMLTVTSIATRTSPVMRGKWMLENLLGAPPPQPPPGVETNLDEGRGSRQSRRRCGSGWRCTARNPVCASCHRIMDPLGFALENFDLVGTWRDMDGPSPIDATGQLADGTPLAGPADLRKAVLGRSDAFVTTATEKLLTYALGRPCTCTTCRRCGRSSGARRQNDHRFSALVLGVVESARFRNA